MFSRQSTIQHKQLATSGLGCIVTVPMHSWTPSSNISNLFERGYDAGGRVLDEKKVI